MGCTNGEHWFEKVGESSSGRFITYFCKKCGKTKIVDLENPNLDSEEI